MVSIYLQFLNSHHNTNRLQRRKLKSLNKRCPSLLKVSACMVLVLWGMIWRKVLAFLDCNFSETIIYCQCLNVLNQSLSRLVFAGLAIIVKYEADLAKLVAERQELTNAEKLLDLPITVYPEIISIQKDITGLRLIYDLYKAQKV